MTDDEQTDEQTSAREQRLRRRLDGAKAGPEAIL